MSRLSAVALSFLIASSAWADGPQPSVLPGQPGGDPAPDTAAALDQVLKGRYEDAIASAKKSLARDEKYVPAMIVMAKAYYYLKKYELSSSIVDIAQKIDPNNAEAYNLLGFIALTRDDKISATAAFKKATELKGDYASGWNNLAGQYLYAKNYDAAIEAAEKATKLAPNFDKAWLNLGSAYRGKGRYQEAEQAYRKALDLNPKYAGAYFNLGILYLDAPQMPNMDVPTKLNTAISHLSRYREMNVGKDDVADGYIDDTRKAMDREKKRLDRSSKQKAPKAAPADAPPAAPAPGGNP